MTRKTQNDEVYENITFSGRVQVTKAIRNVRKMFFYGDFNHDVMKFSTC